MSLDSEKSCMELTPAMVNLFRDMDYIACTPKGHKVGANKRIYYDDRLWSGWFARRRYGEDYKTTTDLLSEVTERVIGTFRMMTESDVKPLLIERIILMIGGLIVNYNSYAMGKGPSEPQREIALMVTRLNLILPEGMRVPLNSGDSASSERKS